MKRIAAIWLALAALPAQNQQAPETVIRISVNLVQVDASVTDGAGNPVTNLKPEDFEILQDGKRQTITNFSYVNTRAGIARTAPTRSQPVKGAVPLPPPPPANLKASQVRRTVALVVDDLGLSFTSIAYVRDALKKFVDSEMEAGDLVAILRTGAGMGALQQFTADKRALYAAIERVKFNSVGRVGIASFAPAGSTPDLGSAEANESAARADEERDDMLRAGSLGAIRYVVDGLRELPGRKSVVLFSESLRIFNNQGDSGRTLDALRHLADAANRASVVIYSIDPRGLQTHALTAADDTSRMSAQQIAEVASQRSQEEFESRDGMVMLAKETGGLFLHNTNDIAGALHKVVADGAGYYLIGYHPDASTFDAKTGEPKFHNVRVRVKRPGLDVRSRTGFFGTTDRQPTLVARTPRDQLMRALAAPFNSGAIRVRLTTLFTNGANAGSFLDTLLHIDARDLQFSTAPDGSRTAELDIVAVTFNDNGQAVDSIGRTFKLQVKPEWVEQVMRAGLVYRLHLPVKKPGAYQMRIALRDSQNQQAGSATQFIEIPDVNKGRLTLSSLVISKDTSTDKRPAMENGEGQVADEDPGGTAAVRVFRPGSAIVYGYQILNAKTDDRKQPSLEVYTRLFRDGKQVYEGKPAPFKTEGQTNSQHLIGMGAMKLGEKLAPGDYVLQVVVTDKLAGQKYRTTSQSMDFEVAGTQ